MSGGCEVFSDYRVTVCKELPDAVRHLGKLLPTRDLRRTYADACHASRISRECGFVELGQCKGYRWGFRGVDNGYALVIIPDAMPKTGFTLSNAIRLERTFSHSAWFEPPYLLAPYSTDKKIVELIQQNHQKNRHWSCGLQ